MQPQSVGVSGGWSSSTSPSSSIRRMDVESWRRTSQLCLPSAPNKHTALHSLLFDVNLPPLAQGCCNRAAPGTDTEVSDPTSPTRCHPKRSHSQDPNPPPRRQTPRASIPHAPSELQKRDKSPADFAASASRTCCFI